MSNTTVKIALIGIPARDQVRINAAFNYSLKRETSYSTTPLFDSPSILIVNADEQTALIKWQQYRNELENQRVIEPPTIFVSRNKNLNPKFSRLRQPLIASQVISTLDNISHTELKLTQDVASSNQDSAPTIDTPANETGLGHTQDVASSNQDSVPPIVAPADKTRLDHTQEVAILSLDNAPPTTAQTEITNTNSYSVLVIDDSLPVRIQMDQALKPYAKHVDFATCAEEAFEFVNTNKYDIIFLDIILPDIDGYEICKIIKQDKAKDTPVIMLTSNSSSSGYISTS